MKEIEARLAEMGDTSGLEALTKRVEQLEWACKALAEEADMMSVMTEKKPAAVPRPRRLKELNIGKDPDTGSKDGGSE